MNTSFTIERNGELIEHVVLLNTEGNSQVWLQDMLSMPYDELVDYEHVDEFVIGCLDATNDAFEDEDQDTVVTLVDDDTGMFIWSVVICPGPEDEIHYHFYDWLADDNKRFKYANES